MSPYLHENKPNEVKRWLFVGSLPRLMLIDETRGIDSRLDGIIPRTTLTATLTSYIFKIKKLFLAIHRTKSADFSKHDTPLDYTVTSCLRTTCMPYSRRRTSLTQFISSTYIYAESRFVKADQRPNYGSQNDKFKIPDILVGRSDRRKIHRPNYQIPDADRDRPFFRPNGRLDRVDRATAPLNP